MRMSTALVAALVLGTVGLATTVESQPLILDAESGAILGGQGELRRALLEWAATRAKATRRDTDAGSTDDASASQFADSPSTKQPTKSTNFPSSASSIVPANPAASTASASSATAQTDAFDETEANDQVSAKEETEDSDEGDTIVKADHMPKSKKNDEEDNGDSNNRKRGKGNKSKKKKSKGNKSKPIDSQLANDSDSADQTMTMADAERSADGAEAQDSAADLLSGQHVADLLEDPLPGRIQNVDGLPSVLPPASGQRMGGFVVRPPVGRAPLHMLRPVYEDEISSVFRDEYRPSRPELVRVRPSPDNDAVFVSDTPGPPAPRWSRKAPVEWEEPAHAHPRHAGDRRPGPPLWGPERHHEPEHYHGPEHRHEPSHPPSEPREDDGYWHASRWHGEPHTRPAPQRLIPVEVFEGRRAGPEERPPHMQTVWE
ncbi:hypothetical protein THASP1DRAFT_22456 [Thamnocephalis sphaerospora]|uniref:Uncharacterized protein n=1 Tax=Thamnocephalis sphaerospora TaxID=78915 RepID=A0A4P9XVT7_9FUNG|nr:hypothetical protein THASP1DRAFT_22456 [Thamnocephalis sphaerospora]|eukprot:RKP09731.1 hypothetical protein THASP1DRAFT_22456 [Thamnocephalis sphaerospora]